MLGVVRDPRLVSLYRYWRQQRGERPLPRRADIDPLELPGNTWPHIMVLDVLWTGDVPRFRYRRVGEVYWRASQREPTGKFVDEVVPEVAGYRDYVLDIYKETATRRLPLYSESSFLLADTDASMEIKRVSLPLSGDGAIVDMILAGHVIDCDRIDPDTASPLICGLRVGARVILDDAHCTIGI